MKIKNILIPSLVFMTCNLLFSQENTAALQISPIPLFQENSFFLGWSPSGKAAFIVIDSVDGAAGFVPYVELIIQNMVSDDMVFREILDKDASYLYEEEDNAKKAIEFIKTNTVLLESLFKTHSISQDKLINPIKTPFIYQNSHYDIHIQESRTSKQMQDFESPEYEVDSLDTIRIEISRGDRRKTIFNGTLEAATVVFSLETLGVVINPFEARAAVFFLETIPDGDGGRMNRIRAVGAHLSRGF